MKAFTAALFVGLALAAPHPQDLDLDLVDALPDPVLVDTSAPTVVSDPDVPKAVNLASISSAIAADPTPTAAKRDLVARAECTPIKQGTNPYNLDLSSAANFKADPKAAAVANNAATPAGYYNTFTNLQAATLSGFDNKLTYLTSYDPSACAAICDGITNCQGFNIYISRDPSLSAGAACAGESNPPTTLIRCVTYKGPVTAASAKNTGGNRNGFQGANIASNGYMKGFNPQIPGYTGPEILGDAAINAPKDCNGVNTYQRMKIFETTDFDPAYCAAACDASNAYAAKHPPSDGSAARICHFFNTYIISINGVPSYQNCALYTQYWDPSYATNIKQYRGDDEYTKTYSYTYYSTGNKNLPVCRPSLGDSAA